MVDFYYKQRTILQVMLAALDDEPENPEPQESVVDYKKLEKIIVNLSYCTYGKIIEELKECESQWLKTKPAVDHNISVEELAKIMNEAHHWLKWDEIGLTWDELDKDGKEGWLGAAGVVLQRIKPAIDPEIKRVYEKIKRIDIHIIDAHELMWKAIKAHVENGGV